jgi:serine protease inhibitor
MRPSNHSAPACVRWTAACIATTVVVAGIASAFAADPTEDATAFRYRQYSEDGSWYVDMIPQWGPVPGYGVASDAATGEVLWTVGVYSQGIALSSDRHHLIQLGDSLPRSVGNAGVAVAVYRDGKKLASYAAIDLLPGAKHGAWLGKIIGFQEKERRFVVVLTDGRTCAIDLGTGKLLLSGPRSQDKRAVEPISCLCKGYREASKARNTASRLFQLNGHLYAHLSRTNPQSNCAFSPYGAASVLSVLASGARGPTGAEIGRVLQMEDRTPSEVLGDLQMLMRVADDVPFDWGTPLGLEAELTARSEVRISAVAPDSPFFDSVKVGHRVLRVNGKPVKDVADFHRAMRFEQDEISLTVASGEERHELYLARPARLHPRLQSGSIVWLRKGAKIQDAFARSFREFHHGLLQEIDVAQPENAVATINSLVSRCTNGRIDRVLDASAVASDALMIAVNVVHFQAAWKTPFEKAVMEPFWISPDKSKNVATMRVQGSFAWIAETDSLKIVDLPYQGGRYDLLVFLPDKKDGLDAVEADLASNAKLSKWLDALDCVRPESAVVLLPKFSIRSHVALSGYLKSLGMNLAFDREKADFSGIAGGQTCLSCLFQDTYLNVNEQGTEAAAATGTEVVASGITRKPAVLRVDRPFVFMIVDRPSRAILFAGHVRDPSAMAPEGSVPQAGTGK